MGKFVYKFDSVKKVKEILEKKAQKELSGIHKEIELVETEFNMYSAEFEKSAENVCKCKKVLELKKLEDYRNSVKEKVETTRSRIKLLEIKKVKKINELIEKSKENKIFETLENIHLSEYLGEEKSKEDKFINDLAVQKFIKEKT